MTPEQNTGMEVQTVGATPAEVGHEAVEAAATTGMVEVPPAVAEQNAAMAAVNEAARLANSQQSAEAAAAVARQINDTRPEGMPSSLPEGPAPVAQELTASTVRSGTGVRIDGAPRGPVQPAAQETVTPQQ